jgi:hypothetical protein
MATMIGASFKLLQLHQEIHGTSAAETLIGGVIGDTIYAGAGELSLKVGDGGNREGGISWGCLTPPLLHQRSDMPCPKITSSS